MDVEPMTPVPPSRPPRWYGVPLRVGLITFLGTLISFAVSLLLTILWTSIAAVVRGVHPDMRAAYRHIALPIALVAGVIILVCSFVMEIRYYRQCRTLAAIEKLS
jgi:hypothetical protein